MFFLLGLSPMLAQEDIIQIKNGSFEDIPHKGGDSFGIRGWYDCGYLDFPRESPPDIHPKDFWENTTPASHGETYLGMVTRDNETWEFVSQRLERPMEIGKCYSLNIELCKSKQYVSVTRTSGKKENFTKPIVLRVWGGSGYCNERQLLSESMPINHQDWKTYEFEFEAMFPNRYITIEAYYKTPVPIPYNGHLLIDNLSDLNVFECPEEPLLGIAYPKVNEPEQTIAAVEVVPPHKRKKPKPKPKKVEEETLAEAKVDKPVEKTEERKWKRKTKILKDLDKRTIRKGQTINIEQLYFTADASKINKESYPVLEEVYSFLRDNPKVEVEIGGHTNNQPSPKYCDWLSTGRAKAVADYLKTKGIASNRVLFKGYGKRKPKYSNATKNGRQKNQRVEIKILAIG